MDVLTSLAMHEGLKHLTMMQLMAFINQATFLRCNIQLAQPAAEPTDTAPLALPESIANFLAQSVGIPMENLPDCWVVGEKWEVTITMAVELDGPVVARVNGTFMANCG